MDLQDILLDEEHEENSEGVDVKDDDIENLELLIGNSEEVVQESFLNSAHTQEKKSSSVRDFIHKLSAEPLLTREQELWLFIQIRAFYNLHSLIDLHGLNKRYETEVVRNLVLDQLVQLRQSIKDIKTLCEDYVLTEPDLGAIFTEIFLKSYSSEDPFPESFFIWLWDLQESSQWHQELVRVSINFVAGLLTLPSDILMNLSRQFKHWESFNVSDDEILNLVCLPPLMEFPLEILREKERTARERLIMSNTRLVISIAGFYSKRECLDDLIQEGIIGLNKAVDKFKPEMQYKFSTYATFWIRQVITRYIADHSRLIRLPVHMHDQLNHLIKIRDNLFQLLKRTPTPEEIALEHGGITPGKVRAIFLYSKEPLSLDMPSKKDSEDTDIGFFIIDHTPDPEKIAINHCLREAIESILEELSPRTKLIVMMRYGFCGDGPMTLEQIGQKMGVTRERIRQIESQALDLLARPKTRMMLKEYI